MNASPTLPSAEQDPAKPLWSCLRAHSNHERITAANVRKLDGVTFSCSRVQGAVVDADAFGTQVLAAGSGVKVRMNFLDRKIKAKLNPSRAGSQVVHPLAA
ncbi:MAG: hypothetical protein JO015_05985 [Verrucomicrobia bacterium]|nr:hypothetical protein [Verrucomicrobiota bacterium]